MCIYIYAYIYIYYITLCILQTLASQVGRGLKGKARTDWVALLV